MRSLLVLTLVLAGAAFAQGKPSLVDAPLSVKVPMSATRVQALQDEFRRLLAKNREIRVPTGSNWRAANAALKRQDCEVRDECLKQLSLNAETLYALFASVERNAAGTEVTASGRVVNQDGRLVRSPVSVTASAASKTPELDALQALLKKLDLASLPAVLTPEPVVVATPVVTPEPVKPVEPVLLPPPPLPASEPLLVTRAAPGPSGARIAAYVTLGVGLAAAVTSGTFGIIAAAQRGTLPADGRFTIDSQGQTQRQVDTFATVSLISGIGAGALLVSSIILFSTSSPVAVAIAPSSSGGAFVVSGRF